MNRQIGSVDCIYDEASDKTYVLEVNYNPQLVTIETFKEVRVQAFLDNLKDI
jgi:D-alanine-D-alanine ligase-like ATP-grasp enzyme